jgi:hypothetical protein
MFPPVVGADQLKDNVLLQTFTALLAGLFKVLHAAGCGAVMFTV